MSLTTRIPSLLMTTGADTVGLMLKLGFTPFGKPLARLKRSLILAMSYSAYLDIMVLVYRTSYSILLRICLIVYYEV